MLRQSVDMHMHSDYSDGLLSTDELMLRGKSCELKLVALTDHDTISGLESATIAGSRHGIKVVGGCEISVSFQSIALHLLAYQFDPHNEALNAALLQIRQHRTMRVQRMVERLIQLGFVTPTPLVDELNQGGNVGLRHVVRAIVGDLRNQKKLVECATLTENDFIRQFLENGQPAHIPRETDPPIEEAVSLVHNAGGLAVIAHPGLARPQDSEFLFGLIRQLKEYKLDGIESYHGKHTEGTILACHALSKELGLFETAGSDFHRPGQEDGELGSWKTAGCQPRFPDWISDFYCPTGQ